MLSWIHRFFIFLSPAVPHEIMNASHLKEVAYFRWTRKLSCRCDLLREQLGAGVNRIVETKDTRNSLLGYVNKKGGWIFWIFSNFDTFLPSKSNYCTNRCFACTPLGTAFQAEQVGKMNINGRKLNLARCCFFCGGSFLFDSTFIALRKVSLFFGSWVRNTGGDDWNESSEEMWFARGAPIRILQFVVYCCVFTLNHSDIHVYCWKSNINYNLSARF